MTRWLSDSPAPAAHVQGINHTHDLSVLLRVGVIAAVVAFFAFSIFGCCCKKQNPRPPRDNVVYYGSGAARSNGAYGASPTAARRGNGIVATFLAAGVIACIVAGMVMDAQGEDGGRSGGDGGGSGCGGGGGGGGDGGGGDGGGGCGGCGGG